MNLLDRWSRPAPIESRDLWAAPVAEAALVLLIGGLGYIFQMPLLFASLGPTAYEQVEQPHARSARPYNIVAGHLIAVGAGFLALYVTHASTSPEIMAAGMVTGPRLWAATLAAVLTTLGTLVARANQPAALATTLLIATGAMQTAHDAWSIVAAVLILTAAGEPLRRRRAGHQKRSPR